MAAENTIEKKSRRRKRKEEETEIVEEQKGVTEAKGKATPGRRSSSGGGSGGGKPTSKGSGNVLTRTFSGFNTYMSEVNNELQKVTWPTREETIRLTRIVLIATIASAVVLGLFSLFADRVVFFSLEQPILAVLILVGTLGTTVWYMRQGGSRGGY